MFALLKRKNPGEQEAREIYGAALDRVREPFFYGRCGVPDSFDGRFDLLLLHIFVALHVLLERGEGAADIRQALFDVMFADMDQTLREMGAGDMSVPKHMRRMMLAFNGRMHAYQAAIEDEAAFKEALRRNLYGTLEAVDEKSLEAMATDVYHNIRFLQAQAGPIKFCEVKE